MLNRRKFIAAAAALSLSAAELRSALGGDRVIDGGWVPVEGMRESFIRRHVKPLVSHHDRHIRGDGQGKVVRLWKVWERAAGSEFEPHRQDIGDCSGQAGALGIEHDDALQVLRNGGVWAGKQSTEVPYIAGRIEIGEPKVRESGGRQGREGVPVAWMVEAMEKFGSLPRRKYPGFDVSTYNPKLAYLMSQVGTEGLPREIEALAIKHKLKAVNLDRGWPQACDLVDSGYPVIVGSSIGYFNHTDRDGFLQAGPIWMHAMLLCGIDTKSRRQGGCLAQSWGYNWLEGRVYQHKYGCIPGGFWADARNIHRAIMQGDSYALIEYDGIKKKRLDYLL
ncbi:MAG: hypothetical protein ACTHK7_15980 [Aureliella sp.]